MTKTATYVDIVIQGRPIKFYMYPSGVEYEIDNSSLIESLKIWDCMVALKNSSVPHPDNKDSDLDSYLTIRLEGDLPWEQNLFGVFFDLYDKKRSVEVEFSLNTAVGTQKAAIANAVSSLTLNSGFALLTIRHGDDRPVIEEDGWHSWTIKLSCSSRQATFADLLALRRHMSQAVFLPSDMITTPQLALRMVQLRQVDALLGLQESEWLEVKSTPYDLRRASDKAWKLELAKDIAQFANSEIGGLLVVGLRTRRINGIDTIDSVTGFPMEGSRVQSYRDLVKERIHPPITGLQLDAVEYQKLHIVYAFVPPQREENKPYLVTGSTIDGIYESQGITIVRRQGDASIPVTAREIHSALVAGRALLRGASN